MIKKSELQEQLKRANKQLNLIYECFPHLEHIEEYTSILKKMGLNDYRIKEVLRGGTAYVGETICNPMDGEAYSIYMARVKIDVDVLTGEGTVTVEDKPYEKYFQDSLLKVSELEKLSKLNPEIDALYKQNQELKLLLSIGKK